MTARLHARGLAALVAAALLLAGCNGDDSSGSDESSPDNAPAPTVGGEGSTKLRDYYDQELDWRECDQGECATASLPVDYGSPDGDTTEVKLARRPADEPKRRIGTLFLNPGGPGGSGIDYVAQFTSQASDELLARYDVVGFDPRGVGTSDPVDCMSDEEQDEFVAADPDPDTRAEIREFVASTKRVGKGCLAKSGKLAANMSTIDVAKDLDVLRELVGDDALQYAGASYGTSIGATYAELFPKRVGRMVLDGAVDPTLSPRESSLAQAKGFEKALRAYAKDCVANGDSCPLGDDVDKGIKRIGDLLDDLDRKPLDTGDADRPLTRSLAFFGIALPLYDEAGWPALNVALQSAFDGDGSVLLGLSDQYFQRTSSGYANNQLEAQTVVNCLDSRSDVTPAEAKAGAEEFGRAAPTFGPIMAWSELGCAAWPIDPTYKPLDIDGEGAAAIVVVGTTRDPATPYEQAVALAKQLDSGVLLSREGDGHTAYHRGNQCIDDALDAYLLDGQVPEDGTRC